MWSASPITVGKGERGPGRREQALPDRPGASDPGQGHSAELGCQAGRIGGQGGDQGTGSGGVNEEREEGCTGQPSPRLTNSAARSGRWDQSENQPAALLHEGQRSAAPIFQAGPAT